MTERSKDDHAAEEAKPEELDAKDLDKVAGGWGRTQYYAPSGSGSTTFVQRSSDKTGSSS